MSARERREQDRKWEHEVFIEKEFFGSRKTKRQEE